jgi:NADPH-dependent curcumin reductase CurA
MTDTMKQIVLASRPTGLPVDANFRLETGAMPTVGKGEVLVRVQYLSLDPYMRGRMNDVKSYADPVPLGGVMEGTGVGEVIASNDPSFKPGDVAMGAFGWANHGCLPADKLSKIDPSLAPVQTSLGILGMPGFTGWYGLTAIGNPKAGETLVIGSATGTVGTVVGQWARILGLRVVGVAGGAEKCAYAVEELGFDACIDYRGKDAETLSSELKAACPNGVGIYWENTGGALTEAVIAQMNGFGRMILCGMIAWYNEKPKPDSENLLPKFWRTILVKRLSVHGFIISDHWDHMSTFISEVAPRIASGDIAYRESISEGLDGMPSAFIAMFEGKNFGKTLVKLY